MLDRAPVARPQTIKQAKAAFKVRSGPALSEREQKQLQRAVELDQRAQRSREAEKRKVDANKRRLEKEKSDNEARARMQLATQRRRDKFGHKCSQMHLGPFFSKKTTAVVEGVSRVQTPMEASSDESFGGSDLDDETLLEAMEGILQKKPTTVPDKKGEYIVRGPATRVAAAFKLSSNVGATGDMTCFFDDMDSSTQIARELAADEAVIADPSGSSKSSSFYDDFDLTAEDIEQLESRESAQPVTQHDRTVMSPPLRPAKPPKPVSTSVFDHGLTIQELEDFMATDIELTQAEPG